VSGSRAVASLSLVITLGGAVFAWPIHNHLPQRPSLPDTVSQNDVWHAPDVYDDDSDGLTSPVLVRETKPNYTAEALQAKIQGLVRMDCIVEIDGSIGAVRIRHSLDRDHGLDAEAVRTIRQWRFKPGMKDGVPVRTRIAVEMSFAVRELEQPKTEWPDDLRPLRDAAKTAEQFGKETFTAENLRITLKYPPGWELVRGGSGDRLIALERTSDAEVRGCTLLKLKPVNMDLMVPMLSGVLDAYSKRLKAELASDPGVQLTKVGQIGAGGHLWIWSEMSRQQPDLSRFPPESAAAMTAKFDGMRIWQFTTTDSGKQLSAVCDVFVPRGPTKDSVKQTIRRAGGDFAEILRGISIQPE